MSSGRLSDAAETPFETLVDVRRRLAVVGGQGAGALAFDGEHAALEVDLDARRVDAGREGVDLHRLGRAADVQRRVAAGEAADAGRHGVEGLLQLALQAIHFREQVAGKQAAIHGLDLHHDTGPRPWNSEI